MRDKGKTILAVAGGIAIGFGIWAPLAARERPPALDMIAHISVGVAFISAAYLVRARRPENKIALLLFAVGVTWYVNDLTFIHHEIPFTLALLLGPMANAVLVHTFVAFPGGRARPGWDRRFVVAVYSWIFFQSLLANIFLDTQAQACGCPRNFLLIHSSSRANDVISTIGGYASFFIALGTVWIVRNHMRGATPPGKRALAPVAWIAGPVALVALARYVAEAADAPIGIFRPLWLAWNFGYCLLPAAIVIGLVRARLGRLAVSDLVVRLSKPLAPGEFEDALADTLGDPSLEILYWLPKDGIYVDADGAHHELPTDEASAVTVVERDGETIGALVYDPALREEPDLVQGVVAAAQLALDNERLHAEVRAQLEEVRASRARIVEAAGKARKKVERDLHDGAQQRLVALSIALSMAEQRAKSDPRLQEMLFGRPPTSNRRSRSCASSRGGCTPRSSRSPASSLRSRRWPAARRSPSTSKAP
ncbi:MAG: histidine kinase [Actinomycetota bacterium]